MLLSDKDYTKFMSKVVPEPNSGCWLFDVATAKHGYAQFKVNGVSAMAHAVSYWHFVGPVRPGKEIHHKCWTPCCVNPDHLEALTHEEHVDAHRQRPRHNETKLAKYLRKKNINGGEFAKLIGVSGAAVSRYCVGERIPHQKIMQRIAAATDGEITANDFFSM